MGNCCSEELLIFDEKTYSLLEELSKQIMGKKKLIVVERLRRSVFDHNNTFRFQFIHLDKPSDFANATKMMNPNLLQKETLFVYFDKEDYVVKTTINYVEN